MIVADPATLLRTRDLTKHYTMGRSSCARWTASPYDVRDGEFVALLGTSGSGKRRIFLNEASVIGFLGGIAGVLLGWAVGRIINFGANYYILQQGGTAGNLFSLPIWLIAAAIGFSIFVSLAACAYPARRAARLHPIHALRHD